MTLRGAPVAGSTFIITGANGGIGLAFAVEALKQGAAKVYCGVRDLDAVSDELAASGAIPVLLDVTDEAQVAAVAAQCSDVNVVINNAGLHAQDRLVEAADPGAARREMEVNYFGPLAMIRAFYPVIEANGGGSVVNVLSVAAIAPTAFMGGYSPAKVAAHYLGGIARAELEPRGITVTDLFVGSVDTKMAAHVEGAKEAPSTVAVAGLKAMSRAEWMCDTDLMAEQSRARLARDPVRYERGLGKLLFMDSLNTRR
jgi:NAD(P)-dependent dehydrogenase (short-subunit alcohol dehydrogenase family)